MKSGQTLFRAFFDESGGGGSVDNAVSGIVLAGVLEESLVLPIFEIKGGKCETVVLVMAFVEEKILGQLAIITFSPLVIICASKSRSTNTAYMKISLRPTWP